MNIKKIIVYWFQDYPGLICDEKGNFTFNGLPCKKVYNNGTIQIRQGNRSFGLKKLRKQAKRIEIEEQILPF